jgi:BASS family bile acid:Na+ symporter
MFPAEWHPHIEAYGVPAQLALAMLGMGATLAVKDFLEVLKYPKGLIIGLVLQLGYVPAVALGFTYAFDLSPGWAVGLFLVAVVPGGAFSNLLTFLGKGNTPLSIAVTVAATAGCVVTVPLMLGLLASGYLPDDFAFPTTRIVFEIGGYLIIPLIMGMFVYRFSRHAEAVSKWGVRLSMLLIGLITVSALGSGRIKVPEYGWKPPAIIVLFGITLAITVPHLCRLLRRYDDDTVALGIEVTVRNIGVALLLIHFFFPGSDAQGHVLYTCLFYAGCSGFFAVPLLLLHRFGKPVVLGRKPFRRPKVEAEVEAEAEAEAGT